MESQDYTSKSPQTMTDFVEIPDDNSSDNDVQEEQQVPTSNPAFDELKSLKSEMEFRGSLLGKTWSELSKIMTRYQSQLIVKHEQLDSSLTGADHFRISRTEQDLNKLKTENEKLHKHVTDLESKLLDKDSEIVTLRTEVHKSRNEVTMKDNLIQKIQGQMAQEALDYQTEITALRDMLETGQIDYSIDMGPVPVSAPQPVKRRRVMPKPQTPRSSMVGLSPHNKTPQTFLPKIVPSSVASPIVLEQPSPASTIKTEPFQSSCQMAASSSSQLDQNEMDSSYSADQTFNESQDSNQEPGFFKVDEVYDDSNSGGMEGLMQGQDPNMLLEGMQGSQEQKLDEGIDFRPEDFVFVAADGIKKYKCPVCGKLISTSSHLRRHYAIHNGDRPYQCSLCMKTFNRRECTKRHIKGVHGREETHLLIRDIMC